MARMLRVQLRIQVTPGPAIYRSQNYSISTAKLDSFGGLEVLQLAKQASEKGDPPARDKGPRRDPLHPIACCCLLLEVYHPKLHKFAN